MCVPMSTGPCRNDRLVIFDEQEQCWVPRLGLLLTDKRTRGNYSVVSGAVWEVFRDCYPGSGPEIKYTYHTHHHQSMYHRHVHFTSSDTSEINGSNDDTSPLQPMGDPEYLPGHWVIDQAGCVPLGERDMHSQDKEDGSGGVGSGSGTLLVGAGAGPTLRRKGVHHELVDVRFELDGVCDEEGDDTCSGEETKEEGGSQSLSHSQSQSRRGYKKKTVEYEAMVDSNITSKDRLNILHFFGSHGDDMDFHVSKDEAIADKYSKGLEEASTQGAGVDAVEVSVTLVGVACCAVLCDVMCR
jgi:hypothetical protein